MASGGICKITNQKIENLVDFVKYNSLKKPLHVQCICIMVIQRNLLLWTPL